MLKDFSFSNEKVIYFEAGYIQAGSLWDHQEVSGTDSVWYVCFQNGDAEIGIYQMVKGSWEVLPTAKHSFLSMYMVVAF